MAFNLSFIKMNYFRSANVVQTVITSLHSWITKEDPTCKRVKTNSLKIPGSSKEMILCEDPGLKIAFGNLKFSCGVLKIPYFIDLGFFFHTLPSGIQVSLAMNDLSQVN